MKAVGVAVVYFLFRILPSFLIVFFYDLIKPFSQPAFTILRYCICKRLCGRVGRDVVIGSNVTIKHWKGIKLGNGVSIHDFSYIDGYGGVDIHDQVSIAHSCTVISAHHTWGDRSLPIRLNPIEKRSVVIEDNVWIGCDVRILGGSKIGRDTIIGAGSIVSKELQENGIYFGSPVKFYKNVY